MNSLKSYKPFYLPLLWIMWLSGISTVIVLMASFLFKRNEKSALFSLSMKKGVEEIWRGMYFWVTVVVPYLRNGIWPLSVKTNSVMYDLERFISINTVNLLSSNRRAVMSFRQCSAKLPWSIWRKDGCLGEHQCSAVPFDVPWFLSLSEFLTDSAVWPLGWGILS